MASKHRTYYEARKANPEEFKLKQGPNGRNLCRQCQTEVSPPRRTFCSAGCVELWQISANPHYARQEVIKRDKYICQLCGINCQALRKELKALPYDERIKKAEEIGIPKHRLSTCLFDIDHIVPVVLGGGMVGLEGLRLLCIPCHRKETSALQKKLAEERKLKK